MKSFKLIWNNTKNKAIGIQYRKYEDTGIIGVVHEIKIYYWKKFKVYSWLK